MAKGRGSYIKKIDEEKVLAIKKCLYCGSEENLMIDHIQPVSRGGNSELNNLTRCCNSCNSSKTDRTLDEFLSHILKRKIIAQFQLEYCNKIIESIQNGLYKIE